MGSDAYARLLKVMQGEAKKIPSGSMALAEVDSDLSIQYAGITLEPDDYTVLTGTVKGGAEVGVYQEEDEFYVIAPSQNLDIEKIKQEILQQVDQKINAACSLSTETVADQIGRASCRERV